MAVERITITVQLDKEFNEYIERVIEEEMRIAQNKWGVSLPEEYTDLIYSHVKTQLRAKLFEVFKHEYNLPEEESNNIDLTEIRCIVKNETHIKNIPTTVYKDMELRVDPLLQRTSAGFIVYNDDSRSDRTVLLSLLAEYVAYHIEQWTRTAVFYGVGSFE